MIFVPIMSFTYCPSSGEYYET